MGGAGPRLAIVWVAQYTERGRRWAAAGFRVAGAVHSSFWRSCSVLEELMAFVW